MAWGRSHRTTADAELIRWSEDLARIEGRVRRDRQGSEEPGAPSAIEVGIVRTGAGGRKRIRVNGVGRRAVALSGVLRVVLFAPEDMLLVVGGPSLRRAVLDQICGQRSPAYLADLATYGRVLQQRNALLRQIREEQASPEELRYWDGPFLDAGAAIVAERLRLLDALAAPLARTHAEIAPDEAAAGRLTLRYVSNAAALPGETPRQALARRLADTAEKEHWNGTTVIGPHRDDLAFELGGRDLSSFASRGQQRTVILALKLAELDLLTEIDGRPPLLLLDDVFSELDPDRRAHLVRRIASLPQAFVTTTTLDDLDPALRAQAASWQVVVGEPDGAAGIAGGATLEGPARPAGAAA